MRGRMGMLYGVYTFFLNREGGPLTRSEPNVDAAHPPAEPAAPSGADQRSQGHPGGRREILNGVWMGGPGSKASCAIPVDRAIDLLAQRGLAARPETPQAAREVTVPTESGMGPKVRGRSLGGNEPQGAAEHPAAGEHK